MINYTFRCDLSILDGINAQLQSDFIQILRFLFLFIKSNTKNFGLASKSFPAVSPQQKLHEAPWRSSAKRKSFICSCNFLFSSKLVIVIKLFGEGATEKKRASENPLTHLASA